MFLAEIVLVAGAVAVVAGRWAPARVRRAVLVVAMSVTGAAAVAVLMLGPRWQLVPVAVGVALISPFAVRDVRRPDLPRRRWPELAGPAVVLTVIAGGPVAAWGFPTPVFPELGGPHAVGTTVFEWTDPGRAETFTADPGDRRVVVAQAWYPAADASGERAPYLGRTAAEADTVASAMATYLGAPPFLLDGPARARTRSVADAVPADGRFPVVLFSPGLGGVRGQNTAWAQELASRGHVVVALDHPHDSAAVVLADGGVVRTTVRATGDDAEDDRRVTEWTAIRAADLRFALTRLGDATAIGPLAGHVDTDRAAVTGHSVGGAAALWAAREDPRFDAVIDIDGFPRDPSADAIAQPVLVLANARETDPEYRPRITAVLERGTATNYLVTVPGSAHFTFTDAPLFLPPVPMFVGSQSRAEGPRLTADATAVFLDATLRGARIDVATALGAHGDVTVFAADLPR